MVNITLICDKCGVSHTIKGTRHLYIDSNFEYKGWFIDENGTRCLCPMCYGDIEYQKMLI